MKPTSESTSNRASWPSRWVEIEPPPGKITAGYGSDPVRVANANGTTSARAMAAVDQSPNSGVRSRDGVVLSSCS